ncbi:LuxR C-terminal-related transcriptional regulator [Amycolatopsis thermoflava]|uniref:LuxR C-terminal-related transcriptional regulator n=1 Tax=Amycolatopsis thermoflava TaxID=84480 RepID=UPI003EBE91E9
MATGWPLVGRAEELRFVATALRSRSGPRGVVLAGAAGVGKTRLAGEALAEAGQRGMTVRRATATASSRPLPLGAFGGLLGELGDLGREPAQLLPRAAAALLAGAGRAGVVIGVDDAHLLDELSATVIHQLVLRRAATVLVTVRTGEPAPDAVTALWKDRDLDRLEVQPLSEREVTTLLESVLGGHVEQASVSRLWAMCQGNVLYLQQLVDGAVENGALRVERGVWRLAEPPRVTPGLVELVAARVGALPAAVREVVDVLAVNEPLGVGLLTGLTEPDAVEDAENRGIVRVDTDGRRVQARLAHPLYGEVRRAAMGRLRARRLRSRIATALSNTGARRADDVLRRAVLMLDSDLDTDPGLLVAAAERASYLGDLPLALRLGRAAVVAGGGFPAQAIVANSTAFLGPAHEADAELAVLTRLAGSDAELVRAAVNRATFLTWMLARVDQAEAVLDEAAARVVTAGERMPLVALRAMIDGQLGRPDRAEKAALSVLRSGGATEDAVLMACCGLVAALAVTGRADQMAPHVARGVEAAARSTERAEFRLPLVALQITGLRLAGHLGDAARIAANCRAQVKTVPIGAQIGCYLVGETELALGRVATAARWLREGRAGIERFGDAGGWRYATLIALTRALAVTGDVEGAHEALADLDTHRHAGLAFLDPEMVLARAWVTAVDGASSRGVELAHEAAELADGRGQLAHVVLALHTAARFGDRSVAGRLATLAGQVHGPLAPAVAAHAAALAADDGDALLAASSALEEIGDVLAAADAAAQAAAGHLAKGRRTAGHAAAARAHALAGECEGATTPALAAAARPLPLTDREREIVSLAARGLSNRQIADRLVVSVRTVEGHLYRASAKLGTTNRSEYAGLLGIHPRRPPVADRGE